MLLGSKVAEITAKAWVMNLIASLLTIFFAGGGVLIAISLPHTIPSGEYEPVWILAGIVFLLSLHELLHACSLVFTAKLPWRAFKFGYRWKQMVFYCHCQQPVTIRSFRYSALTPLATLGSLTIAAMFVYPALWLALITGVHLAGCVGDVWVFLQSRRFADHLLYVDFPDKIGGAVFEPAEKTFTV